MPMGQGKGDEGRRQVSGIRLGLGGAPCCTSPSCSGASRPGRLADAAGLVLSSCHRGDVAQLGERGVRNAEVGSSILLVSTTPIPRPTRQKVGRFCWQVGGLMTQMERGGGFIWGNYSEFPNGCSWGCMVACACFRVRTGQADSCVGLVAVQMLGLDCDYRLRVQELEKLRGIDAVR